MNSSSPENILKPAGPAWAVHHEFNARDSRPAMLFLHGMLSSKAQWAPNLAALSTLVQPVCMELWGHGDSPTPAEPEHYDIDALLAQIERIRMALGCDRVLICGHSFGAGITLQYAARYHDRVIAQVFLNSLSALSSPQRFTDDPVRTARLDALLTDGQAALRRLPFHPRHALRLPREIRDVLLREANRVDPIGVERLNRRSGPQLSALPVLGKINCPTLLVNGCFEKRFQPMCEIATSKIKQCTVADLQAGHAVNLEQPAEFDRVVLEFLQGVLADERQRRSRQRKR